MGEFPLKITIVSLRRGALPAGNASIRLLLRHIVSCRCDVHAVLSIRCLHCHPRRIASLPLGDKTSAKANLANEAMRRCGAHSHKSIASGGGRWPQEIRRDFPNENRASLVGVVERLHIVPADLARELWWRSLLRLISVSSYAKAWIPRRG